ncbi:condensation domain-containing protein, partial [Immundisolibacter sp.]
MISPPENLVERLSSLSQAQRQEVLRRLGKRPATREIGVSIPKAPRDHALHRLSLAQERLWFLEHLQPGLAVYNIAVALRLRGSLDLGRLRSALQALISRHEALRSAVVTQAGTGYQKILDEAALELTVDDLASLPDHEQEAALRRRADAEVARPFDLTVPPLLRARIFRLASNHHVLVLTVHHIVADGWSMNVLLRDLIVAYEKARFNGQELLTESALQFLDFSEWNRKNNIDQDWSVALEKWHQLIDSHAALELVDPSARPKERSYAGGCLRFRVPQPVMATLDSLCRQTQTTPNVAFLAAFQVLLSRYCGQEHFLVGMPVANRELSESADIVGFLVDTRAVPADLSGRPCFREMLSRVRATMLDELSQKAIPFDRLVDELSVPRIANQSPLFQVLFSYQGASAIDEIRFPGLELEYFPVHTGTAKFDLTLGIYVNAGVHYGELEYNTDIIDQAFAERMLDHWLRLLQAAGANPEVAVADLSILTPAERDQQLTQWNPAGELAWPDRGVVAWFEQTVSG